jgi:hypothetical protein
MSIVLFSYQTTYKVGIGHTPFQLVYRLPPLLFIEYLLPSKLYEHVDPRHVRVLTNQLLELKRLQENKLIA